MCFLNINNQVQFLCHLFNLYAYKLCRQLKTCIDNSMLNVKM